MEVLSTNPRVFDITHFFNAAESDALVNNALEQTDEVFGFHRSTTGTTGASVFDKRTSENAWDTAGDVALAVKRCVGIEIACGGVAFHSHAPLFITAVVFVCLVLTITTNHYPMACKSCAIT